MNRKKTAKGVGLGFVVLLILIQLWPVDRSNPEVTREIRWDSPETAAMARRSCYDCHSNETVWPWYAYVAPVSWRVADHVEDGRGHLNFSEWDTPNEDADEMVEVLEEGEMPLSDYLRLHPEARLTEEEIEAFIRGIEATLWNDPPVSEDEDEGHDDEESEGHDDDESEGHDEGGDEGRVG